MLAQAGVGGRGGETPPPQALPPLGEQCQEQPWPPGLGRVWAGSSGYFRWPLACWLWDGIATWLSALNMLVTLPEAGRLGSGMTAATQLPLGLRTTLCV